MRAVAAWAALPLRVYLGGVFLFACGYKILDPAAFGLSIATYQILPLAWINVSAIALPWIELAAGLGLVLGLRTRACALLCAVMMVIFLAAIAYALHLDLELSCGCFASAAAEDEISAATVWRDTGWLAIALFLLAVGGGRWALDGRLGRSRKVEP